MVSSDVKGILRRVLDRIKREEIGEIVQEWGVLNQGQLREVQRLLDNSSRAVPRKTVVQKVIDGCVKQKITKKQISQLDLICHISHPEKKKWAVYELKRADADAEKKAFDPHEYFNDMTRHLSSYFKHDLCMDQRDEAIWLRIGIYEGSRVTPITLLNNAVFIIYHPHSTHLIMSRIRKGLVDFVMQALIQSLGYSGCKETKLTGHHLDSLADLTLNPACQGWFSKFRLNQVDENPLVKTQTRKRKSDSLILEDRSIISENAEDDEQGEGDLDSSFGPNKQPKLEKLYYEMETKFRGSRAAPGMASRDEPFRCTVKFEGPHILEGLKQLRPSGIASQTLPHLFEQVLTTGKNHFRIYDKTANRERKGS